MIFFGKRQKRLGKKFYVLRVYGNLARAGFEHEPGYTHNIAYVVIFERDVIVAEFVYGKIRLNGAFSVQYNGERGFTHNALADKPAGDSDRLIFVFVVVVFYVLTKRGAVVTHFFKRVFTRRFQSVEFSPSYL